MDWFHTGAAPSGAGTFLVAERDDGESVRRARAWVADLLESAGLDELVDDAQLVATELVTNALLHAGPPVSMNVQVDDSTVDIAVHDPSRVAPVRPWFTADAMTGRGLQLVEGLARNWGVRLADDGKVVWAELSANGDGDAEADDHGPSWVVDSSLIELGGAARPADSRHDGKGPRADVRRDDTAQRVPVRLEGIPTHLLLHAQAHVDNLLREFALAGLDHPDAEDSALLPAVLARSVRELVERFTPVREQTRRAAHAAVATDRTHFDVDLDVPKSASDAGAGLLDVLGRLDGYCRAERMLTLESPPQHRVFRTWFIGEIVQQVESGLGRRAQRPRQSFEQRLLAEIDEMSELERRNERTGRLYAVTAALAGAASSQEVAQAVLTEGVAVLDAHGGGILLAADDGLEVPGTLGYDRQLVELFAAETADADLPAADAIRTGEPVWLESPHERDERFPELAGVEPCSASMCAVPLKVRGRTLGALRFSFCEGRLFDPDERAFVQALADQTALALDRTLAQEKRGVGEGG